MKKLKRFRSTGIFWNKPLHQLPHTYALKYITELEVLLKLVSRQACSITYPRSSFQIANIQESRQTWMLYVMSLCQARLSPSSVLLSFAFTQRTEWQRILIKKIQPVGSVCLTSLIKVALPPTASTPPRQLLGAMLSAPPRCHRSGLGTHEAAAGGLRL